MLGWPKPPIGVRTDPMWAKMGLTNCWVQRDGWNDSCASPSSTLSLLPVFITSTNKVMQFLSQGPSYTLVKLLLCSDCHEGSKRHKAFLFHSSHTLQKCKWQGASALHTSRTLRCDTALCRDRIYTPETPAHHTHHTGNPLSWTLSQYPYECSPWQLHNSFSIKIWVSFCQVNKFPVHILFP